MPLSNSVARRYTPPTCTLEIAAKQSPLSRWSDRPVWKQVRFQLHFDDPRVSQEEQLTIRGRQPQLEALSNVVDEYVQRFLNPETEPFPMPLALKTLGTHAVETDSQNFGVPVAAIAAAPPPVPSASQTPDLAAHSAVDPLVEPEFSQHAVRDRYGLALEPRGLTRHHLSLGELSTETTSGITLSTLQLFDLATALDEYQAEGVAVPTLNQAQWYQRPVVWGRIAAGMLLVLGLTPHLAQLLEGPMVMSEADVPTDSTGASSTDQQQQIATRVDPPSPAGIASAPIDPSALQTLPPPPPDGAVPVQPSFRGNLPNVAVAPQRSLPQVPASEESAPAVPPAPAPAPAAPSGNTITLPQLEPRSPEAPTALDIAPQQSARQAPSADEGEIAGLAAPEAESSAASESAAPSIASQSNPSAFDAAPQVAEARQYFQNNWTPPESLTQTLEYSLVLNPDGSIQQVIPLGQSAETYLDRTNMPLRGEVFVSPVEGGSTPRIRLVLSPDGRVRTFLESAN